jgi:hypothetical protein
MKNILIILGTFFLVISNVFGQESVLYSGIREYKKSNADFRTVSVFREAGAEKRLWENFKNPGEVIFFEANFSDVTNLKNNGIKLIIPTKNKNITLELIEVTEDFYNYEVVTSDGKKNIANKNIKHYRGVIQGETNSLVAITFYEDEAMGLILSDEGNFNIVKDHLSGKHFIYNDKNLKEKPQLACETKDDDSVSYEPDVLFRQRSSFINQKLENQPLNISNDRIVQLYFETEYDMYQALGSASSVEAFIAGLFNQVAILYLNEDISTQISTIYIWTSNDPYTATTTSSLLSQFQSTRINLSGDLGMLLTFRNVGGGIAAGFDGICNSSVSQKLAVAMLHNEYNNFPTYSWSVYVVTHEFGHLFGSRHTHACVWNGNNTAIDGCADYVEGNCPLPGYPAGGGTIMSYCHWQSVGINFNLGFGPQPGNVIGNSVSSASCLCDTLYFTNQTVTTDTTVTGCGDIDVQNVTVTDNAELTLDATGETFINGLFEVVLGSQLDVK